ncbi:hypothetical protein BJV38_002853 [Clostridium beijerinckii]|uniref:hypothetical protein n=1 Tax=Clostridium beijerinckii TaxID=1520 RepID=UPI00156D9FA2|nr:hypothetical protein [Clostridium beijerinckii]NRT34560.1 hypothetical protein [Clostridium beijerinckii]NRT46010.1 hypothetical protein [Clostridium beijerinckii]NRZ19988.1 hypothetical protein [Clostridium beijerinckii]
MKTLIIYNKNNGKVLFTQSINEDIENDTFTNICAEIPEGQVLKGINMSVTPNTPVFEDIPKTEIEILKEQVENLTQANAELTSIVAMGKTNA